jgi:hypothetical protein
MSDLEHPVQCTGHAYVVLDRLPVVPRELAVADGRAVTLRAKNDAMESELFRVRIAPLLPADSLRALRCISHAWQAMVDQLLPVKGAFGLRHKDKLTMEDIRYSHAHTGTVDARTSLLTCAGADLRDLQWGMSVLRDALSTNIGEVSQHVTRAECMELLVREHGLSPRAALRSSCKGGQLAVAQWTVAALGLTAEDVRADDLLALRFSCGNGHLAVAQWLTTEFNLAAESSRDGISICLQVACSSGHIAVAQWLTSTFGLTAEDARSASNFGFRHACCNGHLAVAQWMAATFGLTADDARARKNHALLIACAKGHLAVAQWLVATFGLTAEDMMSCHSFALTQSLKDGHSAVTDWLRTQLRV